MNRLGIFLFRKILTAQVLIDNVGVLAVGAISDGKEQFAGYLQDVRIYSRKLTLM